VQRGLTLVVWRGRHVVEPTQLADEEAAIYGREVLAVGRALEDVFAPVKLNYNLLGNSVPHLHTHIIPRYADDPRPGWPFPFPDPEPGPIPEQRLARDVALLRAASSPLTSVGGRSRWRETQLGAKPGHGRRNWHAEIDG
ncbi:MAG: Histidine triad protein, partial [Frankiales bacterium]|nr:Histidine triad protein [Frankiales bacterium]